MSRSRITVEPSELDDYDSPDAKVTEIAIFVERDDEPEEEMKEQVLLLTPAEYEDVYRKMTVQREQGIWSTGSIER